MRHLNTRNTLKNRFPLLDLLSPLIQAAPKDELLTSMWDSHSSFIKSKSDILPAGFLYLNSSLHDSLITSLNYDNNRLCISFNEFSSECFCIALNDLAEINLSHKKIVLPVSFSFEQIKSYSLYYVNRNNKLIKVNKTINIRRLTEYLYDEIIELEPGSISIGIFFVAKGPSKRKMFLILEIKSKKLIIEEFQKETFLNLFGGKFVDLFDEYWSERQKGVLFDYSESVDFIEPRLGKYLVI